jgi:cytochrome c-type biogenesis protein CcmH/NrfF
MEHPEHRRLTTAQLILWVVVFLALVIGIAWMVARA